MNHRSLSALGFGVMGLAVLLLALGVFLVTQHAGPVIAVFIVGSVLCTLLGCVARCSALALRAQDERIEELERRLAGRDPGGSSAAAAVGGTGAVG